MQLCRVRVGCTPPVHQCTGGERGDDAKAKVAGPCWGSQGLSTDWIERTLHPLLALLHQHIWLDKDRTTAGWQLQAKKFFPQIEHANSKQCHFHVKRKGMGSAPLSS